MSNIVKKYLRVLSSLNCELLYNSAIYIKLKISDL